MRLTDKDKQIFEQLHKNATGKWLVDYLTRLQTDICDARSFGPEDSKASAVRASGLIQESLINKIKLQDSSPGEGAGENEYE